MIFTAITIAFQSLIAFLIGTVFFDVIHYCLHQGLKSKRSWLKKIGHLHISHHHFYTTSLKIDKSWAKKNLTQHVILEYALQMSGIFLCFWFLPALPVFLAALFDTCIFIHICYRRGIDGHHVPYEHLSAYRGGIFVGADYHALHHVYINQFFGSYVKVIDYVMGTAHHLAGKKIAMTGASGALGANMKRLLEKEGATITPFKYGVDYTYDDYEKLKEPLANSDILLLCHGSKYENAEKANCDSFVKIIELFKSAHAQRLLPIEIWGVGSEIEMHPCFGIQKLVPYAESKRHFARYARRYFHDRHIQYRHIVHSAFTSRMGPGLMSANLAAKMTIFLIKRGFKYIPVTYTGFAFLNYFRFVFNR